MIWARLERRFGPRLAVLADRFRAGIWRWRGAALGIKNRVGIRCSIQRPWGLSTGSRCQFEHDVFIKLTEDAARIRLGDEVFVGRGVELDIASGLTIGNHVLIAPGCFITDHFHRYKAGATIASQGCESAPVHIGNDVWLGANAVVMSGVTIGDGAVVGSGAVVNRAVEAMTIVAGVPARVVGRRE